MFLGQLSAAWDTWLMSSKSDRNISRNTERTGKTSQCVASTCSFYLLLTELQNDMLGWLMDKARGEEQSIRNLTLRILTLNFAAIHTTTMVYAYALLAYMSFSLMDLAQSFTHTLFYLAAMPQYIQPLREEVENVIRKEGWAVAALGKMRKLDSFLKEVQRYNGLGCSAYLSYSHLTFIHPNYFSIYEPKSLERFHFFRRYCGTKKRFRLCGSFLCPSWTRKLRQSQQIRRVQICRYKNVWWWKPQTSDGSYHSRACAGIAEIVDLSATGYYKPFLPWMFLWILRWTHDINWHHLTYLVPFGHGKHAWHVPSPLILFIVTQFTVT